MDRSPHSKCQECHKMKPVHQSWHCQGGCQKTFCYDCTGNKEVWKKITSGYCEKCHINYGPICEECKICYRCKERSEKI